MTGTKKCANFGGKCHRPPLVDVLGIPRSLVLLMVYLSL